MSRATLISASDYLRSVEEGRRHNAVVLARDTHEQRAGSPKRSKASPDHKQPALQESRIGIEAIELEGVA